MVGQLWAWHTWMQREAVPNSLIDRCLQEPSHPGRGRRAIYAIALAAALGAGGALAATRIWKSPVPAPERTNVDSKGAQQATPEKLVPRTVGQPETALAQDAAQQQAPRPTPQQHQVQRTTKKHDRVVRAHVAASTQPPVPDYLDKLTVRLHVQRTLDRIKGCYDDRLAADPTLAGTVRTHFVILPSGSVTSPTASGLDAEIESCIVNILTGIKFPRSQNGVGVTYPFHFIWKETPGRSMSW